MPNWTTNRLTVSGDEADLERFRSEARGVDDTGEEVDLLLGSLVPEPDLTPLGNGPANGPIDPHEEGGKGGRAWRLVRWGTKWDVSNVKVEAESDRLTYSFLTAWSAPLTWLEKVSGLFPRLVFEFEYQDEGSDEYEQGIYIKCIFRDGEMLERAVEVMSGPPPEEIAQWIEVKELMDARLVAAKPPVRIIHTNDSEDEPSS